MYIPNDILKYILNFMSKQELIQNMKFILISKKFYNLYLDILSKFELHIDEMMRITYLQNTINFKWDVGIDVCDSTTDFSYLNKFNIEYHCYINEIYNTRFVKDLFYELPICKKLTIRNKNDSGGYRLEYCNIDFLNISLLKNIEELCIDNPVDIFTTYRHSIKEDDVIKICNVILKLKKLKYLKWYNKGYSYITDQLLQDKKYNCIDLEDLSNYEYYEFIYNNYGSEKYLIKKGFVLNLKDYDNIERNYCFILGHHDTPEIKGYKIKDISIKNFDMYFFKLEENDYYKYENHLLSLGVTKGRSKFIKYILNIDIN